MSENKIRPFEFADPDICNNCGCRSLELYNRYDKPMGLSLAIKSGEIEMFQKMNARYFRCKRCGAEFLIQWNSNIPIPLTDRSFDMFFEMYKTSSGNK